MNSSDGKQKPYSLTTQKIAASHGDGVEKSRRVLEEETSHD